ncbi:hypothetical protein [Vulcanisaeta thermophila]|uniref:hypothetical protein n=1 Tax=Vulcanisaeta thermophila TaxID=867917 RepID=UPI0008529157|nr:hypothetical protein [Vulcanisaeta thermophila]
MSHAELYVEELRRGNYQVFVDHVISQLPPALRVSSVDVEVINRYRDELLSMARDITESYCTVMSTLGMEFFRGSECNDVVSKWWVEFISDLESPRHWIRLITIALDLFSRGVGVAALITMPIQMAYVAASSINNPQFTGAMAKLAALTTAFYTEALIHLLTEETGTPLSAFMVLAGRAVEDLLRVYGVS